MKNWSNTKKIIVAVIVIVLILAFVYRKEIMKAFGASDETIRKFCGGGIASLGYGLWPYQSMPAVNAYGMSM